MLKNMLSLVGFFFFQLKKVLSQWLREVAKIPIHYQHLCTKPCFAYVWAPGFAQVCWKEDVRKNNNKVISYTGYTGILPHESDLCITLLERDKLADIGEHTRFLINHLHLVRSRAARARTARNRGQAEDKQYRNWNCPVGRAHENQMLAGIL